MRIQICASRILRRAVFAPLLLLVSTFVFGHNAKDNDLADDPTVAAQLQSGQGRPVQLEGEVEIVHQDFKDGHGRFVFTLKPADGTRVPLKFAKHPPTHLLTGDHVRANGRLLSGNLLLYSGASLTKSTTSPNGKTGTPPPPPPPAIPVPNTFGAQSTLVILVNFQDAVSEPYTITDAQNMFFTEATSFFMENSYGQTSITGTVVGWYTIPDSVTTCDMSQIASDAQNAASAAGVNLSAYARYVYAFTDNSACGWAGSSTVGGNPSQSWINESSPDVQTIHHELGHAFGLWHSHSLDCGTTATICPSGNVVEYGDRLDTMGTPQTASAHYNAFQKERLGWLNYAVSPAIKTVTNSGTYTIGAYELGNSGPNALKILKSTDPTTGAKTWYYLEARQALGFDSFLSDSIYYTQNETTGVLIHQGTDGDGNSSQLLDMTPATPTSRGWFDASLAAGQSFADSSAALAITPTNVSSAGATVEITMNGSACTLANPGVIVSPSQSQAVASGTAVNFSVTVTDNDSLSCAPATFNFSDVLPSGWSGAWSTTALALSPGKSGSATLTIVSPQGTADGSYQLGVSASNASAESYAASSSATYAVSTPGPLSVRVSTNQSSYLPGQTVSIVVTMLNGTLPDAGAGVAVTVTTPSGRASTLSGTTASNGIALVSYKLSRRAAPGTYQVQSGTSVAGAASVSGASTSFSVQ